MNNTTTNFNTSHGVGSRKRLPFLKPLDDLPEWQRPPWFVKKFGMTQYMLAKLAKEGHVRNRKMPGGYGSFYNVRDVMAFFESDIGGSYYGTK